jgi:hypothetical protein
MEETDVNFQDEALGGAWTTEKWRSPEGAPGSFKDVYWRLQGSGSDTMLNSFDTI